jgi:membrane-associated phospholipid phosphatase
MTAPAAPRPLNRWHWLIPALALAAGTLAVWIGGLDRLAAAAWYVPDDPTGWPIGYGQPWRFLYRWGVVPAIVLGAAGLLAYAWGCLPPRGRLPPGHRIPGRPPPGAGRAAQRAWRRAGLLLVLSLALGPALLVNAVLHETWGRPRPRQVVEFGGTKAFQPVLVPAWDPAAQSFPTGHAAGGFAVMALYFVWRGRRPGWAWGALGGGLALGGVTAVARMAQGGHWLSDGLWSGGVVYFSAWAVAKALADPPARLAGTVPPPDAPRTDVPRPVRAALAAGGAVALCAGYLAFLPLLERVDRELPLPLGIHEVVLELSAPPASVHTRTASAPGVRLTVTWSGRSGPWATLADRWDPQPAPPGTLAGRYTVTAAGYRPRQNLELWVAAPPDVRVTVRPAGPAGGG